MSNLSIQKEELAKLSSSEKLYHYWKSSKSENTWRAYERHWSVFKGWCEGHSIDPLMATPAELSTYLAEIAPHYALNTIEQMVAALRFWFDQQAAANPVQHIAVRHLMEGVRRDKGRQVKQAPALRYEVLEETCLKLSELKGIKPLRDRLLLLMGYFGAFRRSELVNLRLFDLNESRRGFTVLVRKSKTDQQGKGQVKALPFRKDERICPATTLQRYLALLPKDTDTPLFSSINQWGTMSGKPMSDKAVDLLIKKYFGKSYSAHSLRAGFITDARKKGASDAAITAQTGQKAVTLERYTRFEDIWEMNAALDL